MAARQRALDKKAINEAEKEAREQAKAESELAKEWQVGAKSGSKQKAKEESEMEKMKKKQEMAALLAADEDVTSSVASKVAKKKGADKDLALFKATLEAKPKSKAEKEKERKAKEKEIQRKKDADAKKLKEEKLAAEAAQRKRTEDRGIVVDHGDDMMTPIKNRNLNELETDEDVFVEDVRGIDEALGVFSFVDGGAGSPIPTGSINKKAAYNKFCSDLLPKMKAELPGLKLSQYQERLGDAWKKSSENPENRGTPQPSNRAASRGVLTPQPPGR